MELTNNQFSHYLKHNGDLIMKLSKERLKQIIKEELETVLEMPGDRRFRGPNEKNPKDYSAPTPAHLRRARPPMTDEEADAKHASSMAAIVAALKAEYGDRVKTVKIGGEKAEDLVQAIKEIDPTADVEVTDK